VPPVFSSFSRKVKISVEKCELALFRQFFRENPEQKSDISLTFLGNFDFFRKVPSKTGSQHRFGHFPVCVPPGLEAKTGKTQRKKTKSLFRKCRFWPFSQKGQKRDFRLNKLSTVLQNRTPPFFRKKSVFCEKSRQSFQFSSFFDKNAKTRKVHFDPPNVGKKERFFHFFWPKDCRAKRCQLQPATDGEKKHVFSKKGFFRIFVFFFTGLVLDPVFGVLAALPTGRPVTPLLVSCCRPDFWCRLHRGSSEKTLRNLTEGWGGRVRYTPN